MSADSSAQWQPIPLISWDSARGVWVTSQSELFCEHSAPFLGTWPTSGWMRNGSGYRLLSSAPPIPGSGSSSSPGLLHTPLEDEVAFLLPTPMGTDWVHSSPSDIGRRSPQLRAINRLLPTPRATDGTKGGPNQRGSSGDPMLPAVVSNLLPTPTATDAKGGRNRTAKRSEGSGANSGTTLTDWAWELD